MGQAAVCSNDTYCEVPLLAKSRVDRVLWTQVERGTIITDLKHQENRSGSSCIKAYKLSSNQVSRINIRRPLLAENENDVQRIPDARYIKPFDPRSE